MKTFCQLLTFVLGVTLLQYFLPQEAGAMAAFSRQYNTECSTCHSPYPHRNEFGEAFRRNGFVWPGRPPQEGPEDNEAYWISGILEHVPVSVSLQQDILYDPDRDDDEIDPNTDVFLHLGGTIRDRIGYFAHDITSSNTEAFGFVRHVFKSPVNVKLGRLIPQTTLWKDTQSFTEALPAVMTYSVPGGGDPLSRSRDSLELNAVLGSRWFTAVGVSNRDNQDRMEYYGHLSYKIGGGDFLGHEPDVDFDEESIWDFLSMTLSGFVYSGAIKKSGPDTDFYRLGVEAEFLYGGFTGLLSYGYGEDDDVDAGGTDVESSVFVAEADYYFAPKYQVTGRYEYEDVGNSLDGKKHRLIAGGTYSPIQNVLFRLEGRYVDNEETDEVKTALFQLILHM